jgi:hypothetical protein
LRYFPRAQCARMKTTSKEFKLSGWPEQLPAAYRHTSYRRMLNDLSSRYVSLPQLANSSGASRGEVRDLLRELAGRGVLQERLAPPAPPLGDALRRWFSALLSRG